MNTTRTLLLLVTFIQGVAATGLAHSNTLNDRVASLAVSGDRANELRYAETRSSGLLKDPVIYTGRLAFDPADSTLTKWVDEPRQARLTLTSTQLEVQTSSGRVRHLPLERQPELAALLRGLRALLSGDGEALQAIFQADYLEGVDDTWVMQLKPLDPELAGELVLLELRGNGDELTRIDSLMGSGDRQSMTILRSADAQ